MLSVEDQFHQPAKEGVARSWWLPKTSQGGERPKTYWSPSTWKGWEGKTSQAFGRGEMHCTSWALPAWRTLDLEHPRPSESKCCDVVRQWIFKIKATGLEAEHGPVPGKVPGPKNKTVLGPESIIGTKNYQDQDWNNISGPEVRVPGPVLVLVPVWWHCRNVFMKSFTL